jgi:hypothetical protein
MNQEIIAIFVENKLLSKENTWISCIKASSDIFAFWLYLTNNFIHKLITDFLEIKNEFVAIIAMFVPIIILFFIFKNYFSRSYLVFICFQRQCFTVTSILFYVSVSTLWILEKGFHQGSQIFLTTIVVLFLVIMWRNEIFNKFRRTK